MGLARTTPGVRRPAGIEGVLAVGLGIGMERDACALMRMQLDLLNQGYAAGMAAAAAVAGGSSLRALDVRAIQRQLVAMGALPANVLTDGDSLPLPAEWMVRVVEDLGDSSLGYEARCRALAAAFACPAALPLVREAFDRAGPTEARLQYAALLGFLGHDDGAPLLADALRRCRRPWQEHPSRLLS